MAVTQDQIKVDPYKSDFPIVPLTQMPAQDLQTQQAPAIYSKAGGIAQFADTAMKGLLKGLQLKEQKKYETAQAVMGAQDAAIGDAKKQYQDSLMTKGKDDPETQAKWGAYTKTVNDAAEARQAFAVPEKTQKQSKGQKKSKTAADGAPAQGGFGDSLKQFFAQNPHIVPELAIIGMKSQVDPKLYGQMTPEMTAQKQQMDDAQRQDADKQVAFGARQAISKYGGKSDEDLKVLPATPNADGTPNKIFKNALEEKNNAIEVLTPISANTKYQTLVDPQGQQHEVPAGTQIPDGWKVYEKLTASQIPKAGTENEFTSQALKGYGYTADNAPPSLLKYLHDSWAYKAAQGTTSTSTSTTDVAGNRTNTNQTSRGSAAPKPPAGFSPLGEDGKPQQGGVSGRQQTNNFVTQSFQGKDVPGMVSPGNIDITQRPNIDNGDGTHSSTFSMSSEIDGKEVLYPGVGDGKTYPLRKLTQAEALDQYKKTGKNFGSFKSPKEADAYAQKLHEDQAKYGNSPKATGRMSKPPSAPGAGRGAMTAPPAADGKQTLTQANRANAYTTWVKGQYDAAAKAHDALQKAGDPKADEKYEAAKAQIVLASAAKVKAAGGDPWKAQAKGADGKIYATMDGTNWVDIKTGYPYQEK